MIIEAGSWKDTDVFQTGLTGSTGPIHRKVREERKAQSHNSLYFEEIIRTGTRISRFGRIFTDPCASVSSVQSVFNRTPPIIDDDNKPQMNADERRLIASLHRKKRKAEEQKSLRYLRLIEFHGIPTAQGNKDKVIFQTGLTGSTGYVSSFYPIHLSKINELQLNADDRRFKIATEPRRARSYYFSVFSAPLWQKFPFKNENEINTKLIRTETNSVYSTFGGQI
ncbi:MAG: hypothetical protein V1854_07130 [Methanobacteriota archaeon]